ncbi:glutathione S-transferase family protein [Acinetobacter equi]|uniref:Glutathione S-transferase n=1 Tax=Acinetobacter equi TaxID=1324350 RepID=A0A0N9VCR1_9GAMM|nr:glutathione S-transferase family protein [Acinetobacter equi]ALH94882.1 glutathione S-transferase [Acinetobacter equi]
MKLFIAQKNYSSWSMRTWILFKAFDLPFQEVLMHYPNEKKQGGVFKEINPAGKVPALLDDDFLIWDTLAIAEYLAEKFPEKKLWPIDFKTRTRARCISAEMHSGFPYLRELCSMNIRANFQNIGKKIWAENIQLHEELTRIEKIWLERPDVNHFLCGDFSIADTFYAPIAIRIKTYGLPVSENTQQYIDKILNHFAVKAWIDDALNDPTLVDYYEIHTENE